MTRVSFARADPGRPSRKSRNTGGVDTKESGCAEPYCDGRGDRAPCARTLEVAGAPDRCGTAVMATLGEVAAAIS